MAFKHIPPEKCHAILNPVINYPKKKLSEKIRRLVNIYLHVGKPADSVQVSDAFSWNHDHAPELCSLVIERQETGCELQLCNIVAWTGALVVAAVLMRSLYLMFLKPEGT